ncbi:carbohydrate kinase family protein [Silvibacterium acidisoli]|uniref:carbohydrate kinase family protein n=1 Tax=Acidobacteriaceae bacterium ZG23-2 TaxID=2883246 RepID=UPI00406C14A0
MSRFDVTLVGESNIDLILHGLPSVLPDDRELLASGMNLGLGGSPAITAHNLAALGCGVGFITKVAGDTLASICTNQLAEAGVDLSCARHSGSTGATGVSVLLQHQHSRRTLTYPGNDMVLRWQDLDLDYLSSARHFHLASYFLQEGLRPDMPRLLKHLRGHGLTISLDPNDDPQNRWGEEFLRLLEFVDVLMPNEREACAMMADDNFERAAKRLATRVPLLVIKRAEKGATAFFEGTRYESRAIEVDVIDAIGAGDSFNAGFLHAHLRKLTLDECLRFGNLAGALSITAAGGIEAFRHAEKLENFLAAHGASARRETVQSVD